MLRWCLALAMATACAVLVLVFPRTQSLHHPNEAESIVRKIHDLSEETAGADASPSAILRKLTASSVPHKSSPRNAPESSNLSPALLGPFAPGVGLDQWLEEFFFSLQNQSAGDVANKRDLALKGDANAAFWMYVYCVRCLAGPRTDRQLERKLAEYEGMLNERNITEEKSSLITQEIEDLYAILELCSDTSDNDNMRTEALQWLHTSADLGHMGARRIYHFYGRWLVLGNGSALAFKYPGLVQEFQERSKVYADSILALGHVQAYVLLSEMYFAGDVYPRDFLKSYAYALAAEEIEGDQIENTTKMRLRRVEYRLSPTDRAEARELASTLVSQIP